MLFGSRKAADLRRDSRVLVHSTVTGRDGALGEYKVRVVVPEAPPGPIYDRYGEQVSSRLGWEPTPGRFHLFSIDIHDVTFIRYEDASGNQFVTRWPAGREFLRRGDGERLSASPSPDRALYRRNPDLPPRSPGPQGVLGGRGGHIEASDTHDEVFEIQRDTLGLHVFEMEDKLRTHLEETQSNLVNLGSQRMDVEVNLRVIAAVTDLLGDNPRPSTGTTAIGCARSSRRQQSAWSGC